MERDPDCLKSIALLPAAFRSVFSFRYFNPVQSECFAEAFLSDDNMVVASPTGSGKTVIFELCILRLLNRSITQDGHFRHVPGTLKTVYVGPTKALVQEKLRDWKQKFGERLGLSVQELTGDTADMKAVQDADIIVATPEKFDSVTRRYKDHGGLSFFGDVALFEIDEVHLLHEPRGAALEAIVSRMKMLSHYPDMNNCALSNIRFVAVSATIPNIYDIGEWLGVPLQGLKRFGEEVRPVKLITKVLGYAPAKNDFLFERRLQSFLFDLISQEAQGKAVLVFCSTRKGAQEAAITLSQAASKANARNPFVKSQEQFERLQAAARTSKDKHLQECIRCGVAFHNGGLDMMERALVEGLFLNSDVMVLCTTNTLAHGVNLPAHTVIIKSTQYYNKEKGCYTEYERSTLVQMCGRAGRPQFEDSGLVIIMTRRDTVHMYENLLSGSEIVESELLPAIAEHLNAEIVLMTVSDVGSALEWLKASFLYVRIKKNPQHYKLATREDILENQLKDICLHNVNELASYGLVEMDEYGFLLKPLEPGRLMAKYYLNFETMKEITKAPAKCPVEEMLYVLARSQELSWIQLRRNEKKMLNDINANTTGKIRYHVLGANGKIKKRIQSPDEKIFVLLNDALSGELTSLDFSLNQDVAAICASGVRIVRCMGEYFKSLKRFKETLNACTLAKCIQQKLWEDSAYQLRQLVGVGMVTSKALLQAGIDTFEKLANADPRKIESITGRKFPFGNQIKDSLDKLPPKVELQLGETRRDQSGKVELAVTLTRVSNFTKSNSNVAHLLVGVEKTNHLHFYEKIRLEQFPSPYKVFVSLENAGGENNEIVAALVSDTYVGVDLFKRHTLSETTRTRATFGGTMFTPVQSSTVVPRMQNSYQMPGFAWASEVLQEREGAPKATNEESEPSFTLLPETSDDDSPVQSIVKSRTEISLAGSKRKFEEEANRHCIPVFSASKLPRVQAFRPGSLLLGADIVELEDRLSANKQGPKVGFEEPLVVENGTEHVASSIEKQLQSGEKINLELVNPVVTYKEQQPACFETAAKQRHLEPRVELKVVEQGEQGWRIQEESVSSSPNGFFSCGEADGSSIFSFL